jgi:transposase
MGEIVPDTWVTLSACDNARREGPMPWKECSVVEERLRFVARLLDGEAMTDLCREFGISRKTGYKIFDRYKEHGLEALTDRTRRPVHYANQLPAQVESLIVSLKRNKPHWGARKIRELLMRRLPGDVRLPAKSAIHAVLDRHGLVKRMGKRRARAAGTPLSRPIAANDLWCADFKGEFKLGNGRYCAAFTLLPSPLSRLLALMWFARWVLITYVGSIPVTTREGSPASTTDRSTSCHQQLCNPLALALQSCAAAAMPAAMRAVPRVELHQASCRQSRTNAACDACLRPGDIAIGRCNRDGLGEAADRLDTEDDGRQRLGRSGSPRWR